jgi:hypothetical protein
MKGEQFTLVDNLKVNYIFNDTIDRVFELFKNPIHYQQIHSPFISEFKTHKGSGLDHPGSIFEFKWKNEIKINFKVKEVINRNDFKMIKVKVFKVIPDNNKKYTIYYKFRWISVDKITQFTHLCEFKENESFSFYQVQYDKQEKLKLFKNAACYLETLQFGRSQCESIVLDIAMTSLWEIVTDISRLIAYCPILADSVEIKGGVMIVSKQGVLTPFTENLKIQNDESCEYVIKQVPETPESTANEIHFNLINLSTGRCLLILKHVFNGPLPDLSFSDLSILKQKILVTLKQSIKERVNLIM